MLWHIELKFCIWLWFTILQIKFEYCQFASIFSPLPVKPEGTIGLHSVCQSVYSSVCPSVTLVFPDFSSLCFDTSGWKLVGSFHMKSYRSSSTFITIDQLFHELWPFVHNSFSGLFSAMLSHISMTVGSKLPYEELQIKFDFRHGWPTFSWVIALCSLIKMCTKIMVAHLNLLGSVGDLYCFSNTLSMLVLIGNKFSYLQKCSCVNISKKKKKLLAGWTGRRN